MFMPTGFFHILNLIVKGYFYNYLSLLLRIVSYTKETQEDLNYCQYLLNSKKNLFFVVINQILLKKK
ncbi:hypothetical protein HMPREF0653_00785 [Prevotella disiens JCM 6334 = ATCC 29426]|nr:hypothetical protein HMPREF0653_00785 [Prevotella disiens JCM 6334 = ATCC 29426]